MLAYPHANQVRDFFMAMDSRRVAQGLEELSVHEATARLQGLVLMMHRDTADLGNDSHRTRTPTPTLTLTLAPALALALTLARTRTRTRTRTQTQTLTRTLTVIRQRLPSRRRALP